MGISPVHQRRAGYGVLWPDQGARPDGSADNFRFADGGSNTICKSREISKPGSSAGIGGDARAGAAVEKCEIPDAYLRVTAISDSEQLPEKNRGFACPDSEWRHGKTDKFVGTLDYSGDMYAEVQRYAELAVRLAANEEFDVIHAHDWMTYPAGAAVARLTGKPLVIHVHSTEFDRSGEHVNQMIYDIERMGMHVADKIIAVSYLTRNIIISRYGISGDKVEVVYNGVERNGNNWPIGDTVINRDEKIVLFLGRITMQKGPDYFLRAAKKVLEKMDNVKFVMAGSGDMMHRAVEMAAELGIGSKVLFTGFLRGDDVQ